MDKEGLKECNGIRILFLTCVFKECLYEAKKKKSVSMRSSYKLLAL